MLRTLAILQIAFFTGLKVQAAEVEDRLPAPPDGKSWKLIWHDEFDGNRLDESKWEPRPGGKRKGGWWSPKAISLDGQGVTKWASGARPV